MVKVKRSALPCPNDVRLDNRRWVGFWAQDINDTEFIHPSILINKRYDNKDNIVSYLKDGKVCANYLGYSRCRICGCRNGGEDMTDDVWVWPSGLYHYVEEHNVRLPQEFIDHITGDKSLINAVVEFGGAPNYKFWNEWCTKERYR